MILFTKTSACMYVWSVYFVARTTLGPDKRRCHQYDATGYSQRRHHLGANNVLQVCTGSRCTGFAAICTYVRMCSIDSLKRLDMLRYTVILRHERGQGNIHFSCSADHVQDWQPYPVDPYSCYIMCDHTCTTTWCI